MTQNKFPIISKSPPNHLRSYLSLKARVLRPPQIAYNPSSKAGGTVKPREGGWNLRDRKFVRSGEALQYWVVVAFVQQQKLGLSHAKQFIRDLVSTSKSQGMVIIIIRSFFVLWYI